MTTTRPAPAPMTRATATATTDRYGNRAYAWPAGYGATKDGAGRMRWTVSYPSGDYGMTDTLGEAIAWANLDAESGR